MLQKIQDNANEYQGQSLDCPLNPMDIARPFTSVVWVHERHRVGVNSYQNPDDIDGVGSENMHLSHLMWLLVQ
jgi:hypothetical protein